MNQLLLKKIADEIKRKPKKIIIECRDYDDKLEDLLNKIKDTGNVGHSFDIIVDPDNSETKESFGWDGDGSDYIISIKIENGN